MNKISKNMNGIVDNTAKTKTVSEKVEKITKAATDVTPKIALSEDTNSKDRMLRSENLDFGLEVEQRC